jgi:AraC-like DNA-binding protein
MNFSAFAPQGATPTVDRRTVSARLEKRFLGQASLWIYGAYDTFVRVRTCGPSGGIQVNFTILGARLFLGRPLGELTNQSVSLEDVMGPGARVLADRLRDLPTWGARFDMLDDYIGTRLEGASQPSAATKRGGDATYLSTMRAAEVAGLVAETGWSQKHLIARFRHEIGLAPKRWRESCAFRARPRLKNPRCGSSSARPTAASCGYYDQAHFSRDFRAFAGVSPGELQASLLPDEPASLRSNGGTVPPSR